MPDRLAARVIVIGVGAGLVGQLLFFGQLVGVNWVIWIAAVIGASFVVRRSDVRLDRGDVWLPVAALAFASFIGLREDPGLFLFDVFASSALTLASVVAIGGLPVTRNTWHTIARLGGSSIAMFWVGAAQLVHGLRPLRAAAPMFSGSSVSRRVGRGLAIALPLLIVFVLLFAAADAVFQNLIRSALGFRVDLAEWVGRLVFALFVGWLFTGTLVAGWLSRDRFPASASGVTATGTPRTRPLTPVEAITVLLTLDALFAIFVIIQAAYLFPGVDPLAASGLTYAEYARRGFFELVVVAVISGLVILALDWLIDRATLTYRLAAAGLVAMTGAVLISAAVRLGIYQQVYGWTELRLYVLAAIGLLAFGVAVMLAAIAFGRVQAVPKLVLAAGFTIAFACNVIGPQSFVTAQNLQRAANPALVPADGKSGLDTDYLAGLDADVIPLLVAGRGGLPAGEHDRVNVLLQSAASELRRQAQDVGWPSWNLSRQAALDALTAAGF